MLLPQCKWNRLPSHPKVQSAKPKVQDDQGKRKHREACFAIMKSLEYRLRDCRCPSGRVWEYFKNLYGVDSRAEWTTEQWALVRAQLDAASKDRRLFQLLIQRSLESTETPVPEPPPKPTPSKPAARRAVYEAMPF